MDNPNRRADDKRAPGQLQWDGSSEGAAPAPIQQIELPEEFKMRVRADFEALVRRNAGPLAMLDRHSKDDVFQSGQYVDRNTHAEWIGYSARAAEEFRARALLAAPASADNPSPASDELHIGVSNNDQGVHINIMQRHADGNATVIYSAKAPAGDSYGHASLAAPVAQSTAGAANEREQFENWAEGRVTSLVQGKFGTGYVYADAARAWDAWQARALLAVPALNPSEVRARFEIGPMPVERDENGWWSHPGIPNFDEDHKSFSAWVKAVGLEVKYKCLESYSEHPLYDAWFERGECDASSWEPEAPAGEGWLTFSIHDTEDGPVWVWARRALRTASTEGDQAAAKGDAS